jgi:hypothetical protein
MTPIKHAFGFGSAIRPIQSLGYGRPLLSPGIITTPIVEPEMAQDESSKEEVEEEEGESK